MKEDLADITINEKHELKGFKVLGVFPFYLTYIRTDTHIQLSKLRSKIQEITKEPKINDFYDPEIQQKALPLINEYILLALLNNRKLSWFFRFPLMQKIKSCSHKQLLGLYLTIQKMDEPAFFLAYWKLLNLKDNTILSEVKQ